MKMGKVQIIIYALIYYKNKSFYDKKYNDIYLKINRRRYKFVITVFLS